MTMGSRLVVLNDGLVMQIDTPANLYSKPKNKFVAGFLGSPQINFFEGVLFQDNGLKFIENDSQIIFNLDFDINFAEHEKVTLGIRPENMIIDKNEIKNENGIQVQITNIEYLGHETIIYFKTSGSLKCIRTDTKLDFNTGDIISIYPETGSIHVFDGNGMRIG
jgi:multiple sugar transport system ATP-binding protein